MQYKVLIETRGRPTAERLAKVSKNVREIRYTDDDQHTDVIESHLYTGEQP